ncbi:MAG: hypothetical protein K6L60_11585 [Oceanobacter sp.]
MKTLHTCLLVSTTILMVACGGTSNDDDAKSSADLKVDPNFELKSTGLLKLDVDLASLANERAYLYVCQRKDTTTLNYDRCLVKTPISQGQYDGTFTLGNDTETLGLEVWTYNPDDEPVQYSWARSKDGMSWNVSS